MNKFLFGTAGIPMSTYPHTTRAGIKRVKELGLGCMEIEFVHGVRMNAERAGLVSETAKEEHIALSVHASYYVNLNSREPEKITASCQRILRAARIGSICGARNVVFHPAFYGDKSPEETYAIVKEHVSGMTDTLREEGCQILLSPEVMGKVSQFGTLEETLNLCSEIEGTTPCMDFAHWHARTGKANSYDEFSSILKLFEQKLGKKTLRQMHIHVSGIDYGPKGERKHLTLAESDFQYRDLLKALHNSGAGGTIICESPNQEEDALLLQKTYRALLNAET
ncbi:MAG: TIM barrel protein [Dehalococcoidia bacterium]|nr:TIM barrel protein [Dehalococcoidia bacterium]